MKLGKYKFIDKTNEYSSKVSGVNNKNSPVNRWYPVLESFSDEFVCLILDDHPGIKHCLDPFAGGGTTPLVAQKKGIKCTSFEVNPFLSQVCRAKLRNDYSSEELTLILKEIQKYIYLEEEHNITIGLKTIQKNNNKKQKKWLFHPAALNALLTIRKGIDNIAPVKYKDLLYISLASIVLEFSNVFRDGKALKYRPGWEKRYHKKKSIYKAFFEKFRGQIIPDIVFLENNGEYKTVSNLDFFRVGDARLLIDEIECNSVDLVITSPPYLNSRDYTDSNMIELWLLNHINNYDELRELRKSTIRSHVQVAWEVSELPNSRVLKRQYNQVLVHEGKFWNKSIPSMISGYFNDIDTLLRRLKPKLTSKGTVYINVANSAYFGVMIETDRIIAELAERIGYGVKEIRLARNIKTSSQQTGVDRLRESVIVLTC